MNVGLIMQETGGGFAEIYFTRNLKRARCIDPDIDEDLLLAMGREIEDRFRNIAEQPKLLSELIDRYSSAIQLSSGRSVLAADPAKEMKSLIASLIETSPPALTEQDTEKGEEKQERTTGRKWLRSKMKEAFWAEGLKDLVRENRPAAPYTNEADDFTIDFSYVYGDKLECIQAVSLINIGMETRMFPLRVAKMKSGAANKPKPGFTAVVENYFNREDKDVKMVIAFMDAEAVHLATVAEMPDIARQARFDLGV